MKWFLLIVALVVGYAIFSGNMGGARDAGDNYNKLLQNKAVADPKHAKKK